VWEHCREPWSSEWDESMTRRAGAPQRHVPDSERRARLGTRHALAPAARVGGAVDAARAVVALHATEPSSVHLSCWARMDALEVRDVERALYDDRSLVRQLSMRETLFVVPRDLLPAVWCSVAVRIARAHRGRMIRDVERHGLSADGQGWVDAAGDAVVACLADGRERSIRQLRDEVPEIAGSYKQGAGTSWAGRVQMAPRVLRQLSLEARITRAHNDGSWYTSRPLWTTVAHWLGETPPLPGARRGYTEIVRRWLWSFGPGTVDDLRWWLGDTTTAVRDALEDLDAVAVSLDRGGTGWLLPDDLEPVELGEPWVALLPLLDPSVMGWKERGFYLGPHAAQLFDSVGNAGTTAWVNGRVVGAWVQDADQVVQLRLLEDVGGEARAALEGVADRLTTWLDGHRAFAVYPSPVMRE
jgi:hypothetical protein